MTDRSSPRPTKPVGSRDLSQNQGEALMCFLELLKKAEEPHGQWSRPSGSNIIQPPEPEAFSADTTEPSCSDVGREGGGECLLEVGPGGFSFRENVRLLFAFLQPAYAEQLVCNSFGVDLLLRAFACRGTPA